MKNEVIKVGGMSCVRCSAAVENSLKSVNGVESCEVSYANGKAFVCYDEEKTDIKILEKAIKRAGYEVIEDVRKARKREFRQTLYTFIFALVFALPFFVMMGCMMFGLHLKLMHNGVLQLILAAPIQFVAGFRFYKGAVSGLKNKSPSMDLLVALGTTASFAYSVYSIIIGSDVFYFESSAMIITLVLLGKLLESRARAKTSEAIEKLMDLAPKSATVLRDGREEVIPASQIVKGDTVIVHPGEAIAADGYIVSGSASIDESMLTGESMPASKGIGDSVFGGTVNGNRSFSFVAEGIGEETVLSGIIRLVEDAQSSKAHIQSIADKVAAVFVPSVAAISAITFFATWLTTNSVSDSLDSAVAVLVIACPCSLGLATPTALMVGLGRGASMGILIKNADSLELACKIKAIVLDKTGTLTEGKPKAVEIRELGDIPDALMYAACAESRSEHPLASVICELYSGELPECEEFESVTGNGVTASVNGKKIAVGKPEWVYSLCGSDIPDDLASLANGGNTVVAASVDGIPAIAFAITDPVRSDSRAAIEKLHSFGIRTLLVTGDNESTAKSVCEQVGIDEYVANALPAAKVESINKLKSVYGITAMVGDGINDAPALTAADVGFAVESGTDIAMESGDIVLVGGGISAVSGAISLSKATMRRIKQNLFWAFFYNTIGIPLAAFGLLNPIIAGAAMAFSSVSVVTNSLLLKKVKL